MQVKSNAKINLGLNILAKRPDGFHNIESVFLPISWYDYISIHESKMVKFSSEGIDIPESSQGNLCLRAYELLNADFDLAPLHLHLNKKIPIGAGLGGGSADAAFVLKALNKKFNLQLNYLQLEKYAASLGSDCVFFIRNQPALVKGRGEQITVDRRFDVLRNYHILMLKPDIFISTQEAYQNVVPKQSEKSVLDVLESPIENWKANLVNDFEAPLFKKYKALKLVKNMLYDYGAIYASMSGSGSCFYGIFDAKIQLDDQIKQYTHKWVKTL